VTLVARAVGVRTSVTRAFSLAAALETAGGALAFTLPLALHRAHPLGGHVAVGWLAWLVLAVASGALVGTVFLALTRQRSERADVGFVLLATLLLGAGVGYAVDLSPFLVCALATALIVNASPRRRAVRQVLADWEPPIYPIVLGVAVAQLAAPPLMALALRTRVASPVAPAPLTPAAAPAELGANATADWPR